jgi:hypothetical protein
MKMRPLAPAPAAQPVGTVRPATDKPPAESGPPRRYAGVGERDAAGIPTRLELPADLAAHEIALYARRPDGSTIWLADVRRDGAVKGDGQRDAMLAALRPGVRIVATPDPSGRIIALSAMAVVRAAAPAPSRRRSATPERVTTRAAADPYEHRPHELCISGGGRVLRVS